MNHAVVMLPTAWCDLRVPIAELRAAILEVNGNLSCRCVKTTSDYISPKRYDSIELRPVGSTCRRTEIIIKLKSSAKVCVNPDAPWVKKLLKRVAGMKKR
ncbi:interleukin-8-like isoform X2 [Tympanuchus pallidicinctus]|uniref:interleukin-8-like isoform X2 n=1 Tax=Tympanuchus pallidicinctus TaxID=109042 RepID=UPI0022871836|nr:interleukin-8-like isoform X2 [Tympanuchus pallidicinctus]